MKRIAITTVSVSLIFTGCSQSPNNIGTYILAGSSFWTLRARRRAAFRAIMHPLHG